MNSIEDLAISGGRQNLTDQDVMEYYWGGALELVEGLHEQFNTEPHTWSHAVIKAGHRGKAESVGVDITHVLHERGVIVPEEGDLKKPLIVRTGTIYVNTKHVRGNARPLPPQEYQADRIQVLMSSRFTKDLSMPEVQAKNVLVEYERALTGKLDGPRWQRGKNYHAVGTIGQPVMPEAEIPHFRSTLYILHSIPFHTVLQDNVGLPRPKKIQSDDELLYAMVGQPDGALRWFQDMPKDERMRVPVARLFSESLLSKCEPVRRGLLLPGGIEDVDGMTFGEFLSDFHRPYRSHYAAVYMYLKRQAIRDFVHEAVGAVLNAHEELALPAYERALRRA